MSELLTLQAILDQEQRALGRPVKVVDSWLEAAARRAARDTIVSGADKQLDELADKLRDCASAG